MRIHPLYVSMLANPSNHENYLPHEPLCWPVADLTKFLTRLPFRTSTFSKSTYFVLPQHVQRSPKANSRNLTHLSTI